MTQEIERRFLVKRNRLDLKKSVLKLRIEQFYVSEEPSVVRFRVERKINAAGHPTRQGNGSITIKGRPRHGGFAVREIETPIPGSAYKSIRDNITLEEMIGTFITKVRHIIPFDKHMWEVDVFEGDHEGLIIAEIELKSEDEGFERPSWLGEEITSDHSYSNISLAKRFFACLDCDSREGVKNMICPYGEEFHPEPETLKPIPLCPKCARERVADI